MISIPPKYVVVPLHEVPVSETGSATLRQMYPTEESDTRDSVCGRGVTIQHSWIG